MTTKAVRMYGKRDLRLDTFELPEPKDDEILAEIISDSLCMSSWKAANQGADHKRVPNDIAENPVIVGHEFCGRVLRVGAKWADQFKPGDKYAIQPALNLPENPYAAPGYSFRLIGGSATHIIIPNEVMAQGCLLPYDGDAFFHGSLSEPMSCIVGAFHANYHTTQGSYDHQMGIVEGGNMAILAGVGPMGLGAIDLAIHGDRKPGLLVVTDIDAARLARAESLFPVAEAASHGVRLLYVNTAEPGRDVAYLRGLTPDGFDDVFVFAPVRPVVEMGDKLLGHDGCLNFFAGPGKTDFSAEFNFYNVHYNATHIVGTSGGNTSDMLESLQLMSSGRINPAAMVTHIGGLGCVVDTTLELPNIPGGKKLIYTQISMPLTALADLAEKGKTDPMFVKLAELVDGANGLWSVKAEEYLLAHATRI